MLCYFYIIVIFILLHCPLSGPDFTYISLLIIPCIIYYVTNKETLNLETILIKTSACVLLLVPSPHWTRGGIPRLIITRASGRVIPSCLNVIWERFTWRVSVLILIFQSDSNAAGKPCVHSHIRTKRPGLNTLSKTTAPAWYWSFTQALLLGELIRIILKEKQPLMIVIGRYYHWFVQPLIHYVPNKEVFLHGGSPLPS